MHAMQTLLLAALLGVGGCSTTVFESVPVGASTDCDPAWPGHWQPVAHARRWRPSPRIRLEISADC